MITFFLLAACLVVLVLLLLLPTLTKNHQSADRREINVAIARSQLSELAQKQADGELAAEEFAREKQRIELDLADALTGETKQSKSASGHWAMWPLAVFVPLAAGIVYLTVGTPEAIDPANRVAVATPTVQQAPPTPDMREVVTRIKERLAEQPEDATGWFMLGRAHMTLGEFSDAVSAIRRAYELTGENPEIMVRLADAIAMSQGGSMAGEPEPLLEKALSMQPDNLQGLWLIGIAQNERADYAAAIGSWERLLPLLGDDPRSQQEVSQLIADARAALADANQNKVGQNNTGTGGAAQAGVTTSEQSNTAAAEAGSLTVEVVIDTDKFADVPPETALFIYARAQQGPPMPLAVARRSVSDLPLSVTLSDADAMLPAMKISAFDELVVGARVSFSGNAIAQPGDLFSEINNVSRDQSAPVRIEIDKVVE